MEMVLSEQEFELFRNVIYNQSGINFSNSNRTVLESRLRERLRTSQLDTVRQYYDLILKNDEEMREFLDSVTTNLTRFFRNTAHFQTFENFVLPNLTEHKKNLHNSRVRIWSAGCSTGEEPYSVAIAVREKLDSRFQIEIIGSDLSLKSLMTAKKGFYPESRVDGIPPAYLSRYFDRKRDGYQIRDEIKKMVRFDYHNLKFDSGLNNIDIIFCRNVLIYFDGPAQKAVVDRFWKAMTDHSFLFIGHSESLFGMNTKFEFVKTQWACIYRRRLDSAQ